MSEIENSPSKEELEALLEGELDWSRAKELVSGYKDSGRFHKVVDIYQRKVAFDDEILIPLSHKLFIVDQEGEYPVRCECGEELIDDYRKNWKLGSMVNAVNKERLDDLYLEEGQPDLRYCEIREFDCPSCGNLLEVETVPRGYPILHDFLPDMETFFEEWIGESLDESVEFEDLMTEVTTEWG